MNKIVIINKDELRETLYEFSEQISRTIIEKMTNNSIESRKLMNLAQVADYLQCSKQSVKNWTKRPEDKNPLPMCSAGADPRFFKGEVDLWMREEAKLKNLSAE